MNPNKLQSSLQSLNILTSGSVKGPVFIIGMDRKIVAAALANKNSAIVSYLSPSSASGSQTTATDDALDYGYAFMDKFIQLPLRVPRARREHLERLLRDDPAKVQKTADSPRARSIIDSAAAILDYNPRRLKQFINVFRLNVHTFVLAGRISDTPISRELLPGMQELTLEKLGLFLSLVLRWPRLVEFLSNNPRLLRELQKLANDEGYTPQGKLHDIERFRGVVACLRVMENSSFPAALWSKEEREKIFSLEELDIADLLATTPLAGRDWTVGMDKVPDFSEVSQVTPTGLQTLVRSRGPWHSEALELVYPLRAGRLVHCRYDPNDGRGWRGLETFGSDAVFEEVAMIQSDYMHGNLEAIARRGDRLEFCYHPSDDISHWNVPYGLDIRVDGRPLLIQSALGENGNFELVIPLTSGGLQHWWRDNTEAKRRWRPEQVFATDLANPRLIAMFEIIEGGQSDLIVFCQTQETIVSIRRTNYKWGRPAVIGEASIPLGFATAVRHPNIDSYYDFFIPTESSGIDRFVYDEQGKWSKLEQIAEGFQVNAVAAVRHKNRCDLIMRSSDSLYYFAQSESGSNWTEPISITQHLEKQTSA